MKNDRKFHEIWGRLARLGFNPTDEMVDALLKVRRLERKHQRLSEYDCNGDGYVNGKHYRTDTDAGYVSEDETVFHAAAVKVREKIIETMQGPICSNKWRVEFQGDPRGYTVRVYDNTARDLSSIIFE